MIPVSQIIQQAKQEEKQGKIKTAIATYQEALSLYPSSAWSYYYLGEIYMAQDNLAAAIDCYQQAIKYNPTVPDHYIKLGEIYFKQRQLNEALNYFKEAISLYPNSAWSYQHLAEIYAQLQKWLEAVTCYRQALKINPQEVIKYHNSLKIEPDDPQQIKVTNPIFIVGCGHSGTSIMLAILNNHPQFYGITYESALFKQSEAEIRATMQQWDEQCIAAGKKRWIEKTPPHIFQIKKFLLHRPQSQFIIMLRDGRDVVCSLKHRTEYKSFETRVDRWIYENLAGLPYWDHPNVTVVKYEDLVSNPEKTLEKVLSFLGEEYIGEVLNYHQQPKHWYHSEIAKPTTIETQNDHHQLRNWQINQPLFDGRGRWQTEMSISEQQKFQTIAQKYLRLFGYDAT